MPYVTSGEASIYYEVHGDGPCLVFAHGRGGNAASWWQQVPEFARTYKVIVFDHRCFGRSGCPSEAFDRERFDTDLIAILDAERVDRAAIVCQSMGGWTGLRTALRHPGRVSCLVLSNTPGGVDTEGVRAALLEARETFASKGVGSAAVADDFADRAPEAAYLYRQIGSLNLQIPDALSHGGDGWVPAEALKDLRLPILVITSENDQIFPPAIIGEVAGLIPGAQFVELPVAGHSPYYETPEQFNRTIKPFLDSHCHGT
jgi:pimeloyl-ACP methyl ester carboxylesterase